MSVYLRKSLRDGPSEGAFIFNASRCLVAECRMDSMAPFSPWSNPNPVQLMWTYCKHHTIRGQTENYVMTHQNGWFRLAVRQFLHFIQMRTQPGSRWNIYAYRPTFYNRIYIHAHTYTDAHTHTRTRTHTHTHTHTYNTFSCHIVFFVDQAPTKYPLYYSKRQHLHRNGAKNTPECFYISSGLYKVIYNLQLLITNDKVVCHSLE